LGLYPYGGERRTIIAKAYGIKVTCYWELFAVISLSLSPQALERLYKDALFGSLPVFITSNIECQLFPQPHPINMKI
jgi:hypothetical protein